jgi:hypothetical protein
VALAYMGRKQEAEQCRQQLLKEMPGFNCEFARNKLFYLKRDEQIQLYIGGLKLAGVAP